MVRAGNDRGRAIAAETGAQFGVRQRWTRHQALRDGDCAPRRHALRRRGDERHGRDFQRSNRGRRRTGRRGSGACVDLRRNGQRRSAHRCHARTRRHRAGALRNRSGGRRGGVDAPHARNCDRRRERTWCGIRTHRTAVRETRLVPHHQLGRGVGIALSRPAFGLVRPSGLLLFLAQQIRHHRAGRHRHDGRRGTLSPSAGDQGPGPAGARHRWRRHASKHGLQFQVHRSASRRGAGTAPLARRARSRLPAGATRCTRSISAMFRACVSVPCRRRAKPACGRTR